MFPDMGHDLPFNPLPEIADAVTANAARAAHHVALADRRRAAFHLTERAAAERCNTVAVGRPELPGGTVTFVFTDIEGSTRLLRRLGDRYPAVLDRHYEIIRGSCRRLGGIDVSTEGDSLFCVFADRSDALKACADAQRLLAAEPWPHDGVVKVRMGVHTGLAWPHGDTYAAIAVHLAARVVAAARGGQVLATADAARGASLPDAIELRPVGRFRIRDFDDPVELWQLSVPGVPEDRRPPRVPPADGHNLSRPLTPLLGRSNELGHLDRLVTSGQAVTIVGPGGVGKTRLAIEHGLRSLARWPDGVWLVELAHVADPSLVAAGIASALGVRPERGADAIEACMEHVAGRTALLILDNAEHLRRGVADAVTAILRAAPMVGVLTTSREVLGLRAEQVCRLGALGRTDPRLETDPAVQLFTDRADSRSTNWRSRSTPAEVLTLVERLDRLPLAIEMAAARIDVTSLAEMLTSLEQSTRLLTIDDPSLAERHRSLTGLLDWSDRLLQPDERALFHRLAVFAGSFNYETAAVAAAPAGIDADAVPELIWALAGKSLVVADAAAGATSYRLLETVKAFVRRRIESADARAAARQLAVWYLDRVGPDVVLDRTWLGRMGDELDNIRGVIAALAGHDDEPAQRLAWSLGQYLDAAQAYEGIGEVERLSAQLIAPTSARVGLLTLLADLRMRVGDVTGARDALSASKALRATVGPAPWDDLGVERTEGGILLMSGDVEGALRLTKRHLDHPATTAQALRGQGRMWNLVGLANAEAGDWTRAAEAFSAELDVWQRLELEVLQVSAHGNVAEALLTGGDLPGAATHQLACLELALQHGQPLMVTFSLMIAARAAVQLGRWTDAVDFSTIAEDMLTETGATLFATDRELIDQASAAAVERIGRSETAVMQREVRQRDRATIIERARELLADVSQSDFAGANERRNQ